jgi:hypothetical protein
LAISRSPVGHRLDRLCGQREAVDERVVVALGARGLHVLRVLGEQRLLPVHERLRTGLERAVARAVPERESSRARGARGLAHGLHHGVRVDGVQVVHATPS